MVSFPKGANVLPTMPPMSFRSSYSILFVLPTCNFHTTSITIRDITKNKSKIKGGAHTINMIFRFFHDLMIKIGKNFEKYTHNIKDFCFFANKLLVEV